MTKTTITYNWKDKKILIAEDMETSNFFFEAALRKTGINILWASNGKEAVELAKRHNDIDLVLMDINMPELNGLDATRIIREFNQHTPIIVQTAYVLSGENEKSKEAGASAFLSKPIKLDFLLQTIHRHLKV